MLVQYILLRGDLKWSQGALIAQACHASIACLFKYKDHPNVLKYTSDENLNRMHKVVLKVKDENELEAIHKTISDKHDCYLWHEQPENIPVCLACLPLEKDIIHPLVKHLPLFK
ncbi:putative peptidyl-tRNA hydrolase PTRHD1-like protein [Rozella allomycis CSF55]|uniref:peptidyl-tRNA hydrolase n=1 Tax=Rozella allomycis (strain CSF55) TaxID=988480 RepID=A0A075B3T1_ROZAC|nr:Peptidyl-tRNA hydrolase II domain-containing protein [Rozella allomycis CSF55]RKP18072.1 putative peptidyl-tRNA hydrolase PTRHD1-like protein [Rozella allomycis CSF55]|eukprot:EPZ35563.1 Peptidyl-tRNA hydrolase II domain-containing protein [Rozella allomycis CSF55]